MWWTFIVALIIGGILGFGVGFLAYRNNQKKLVDAEAKIVELIKKG
jgi:hypothetical protein